LKSFDVDLNFFYIQSIHTDDLAVTTVVLVRDLLLSLVICATAFALSPANLHYFFFLDC
jgi:hypothetical protein